MGCVNAKVVVEEEKPELPKAKTLEELMAQHASQRRVQETINLEEDEKNNEDENNNNNNHRASKAPLSPRSTTKDPFMELAEHGETINGCTYGCYSRRGFLPYHSGKVNQDRFVVETKVQDDATISLFAVMDGHGDQGHTVADYVRENLPDFLAKQHNLRNEPFPAITNAIKDLVDELATKSRIDISFSGTTIVFALLIDNSLFVGNIGDARAVLARQMDMNDADDVEAIALSMEHKPDKPEEKARILKFGGRVHQLENDGPLRVWLAEVNSPGLTVTRSIGDEVSNTVGVISVPELRRHDVDRQDLFVILGTDGLWQFVTNEEAVDIVRPLLEDPRVAAKELVQEARRRWESKEDLSDDLTCIILNFNH